MGNSMQLKRERTDPKRWRKRHILICRILFFVCVLRFASAAYWNAPPNRLLLRRIRKSSELCSLSNPWLGWNANENESHLKMTATEQHELTIPLAHEYTEKTEPKSPSINDDKPNPKIKSEHPDFDPSSPDHQVCRVVALPDGKLPTAKSDLPASLVDSPVLLDKLDAIYNAMSHEETRRLRYLERSKTMEPVFDEEEEANLVSVLRTSLEDAGFELLSQRDVDLCEALNVGYLLRLSIAPDVAGCDPTISREFYPEHFDKDGNPDGELLFGGRVLLYRRGYSSETTEGKLLLPKLDYLQASVVQRSARRVTEVIGRIERRLLSTVTAASRKVRNGVQNQLANIASNVPNPSVARFLRVEWGWKEVDKDALDAQDVDESARRGFFKFSRYSGSNKYRSPIPAEALDPFLSCDPMEVEFVNGDDVDGLKREFNNSAFTCQYDFDDSSRQASSIDEDILLERISINNVVDLSTSQGRRNVVKRFFAKSKLVEPTFEEVVAIWRPLPEKPKRKVLPPKFVYSVAEIFEWEDKLPEFQEPDPDPLPPPLEIRSFDRVPMANAFAVLPKTKLLFRPADAFVFDFVTFFSFAAVIFSQRFDNPRLDLLALVSGTVWIIRTIIRYSNKLARYDLLVKKFLTSKISHRNSGALKYITREAGNQRATRAALVYLWLAKQMDETNGGPIARTKLIRQGSLGVNGILQANDSSPHRYVRVDIDAALNDLSDLNLIEFDSDEDFLVGIVRDEQAVVETLRSTWDKVFDETLSHNRLIGRRDHSLKSR